MDWFLSKMRLVDVEEEHDEPDKEMIPAEKPWLELVHRKKDKEPQADGRVYFKSVQTFEDCKQVIASYKMGAVCVYTLNPAMNPDAQGMMNYICGGLYALDGEASMVGENVFIATAREDREEIFNTVGDKKEV